MFLGSTTLHAQFGEIIRTGRPGQAIGPFTVGKNVLHFQQGLDYYAVSNFANKNYGFVNNNVIRFGILETVELSTLIEYEYNNSETNLSSIESSGISNLHLGFRVHLTDQKGIVPTTGFQMRLKIPSISKDFGSKSLAPIMVFVANWNLPKNCSLGTNWILSYSGNDIYPTGKYVLNFGFPIANKFSGFVENYGQLHQFTTETRFDGGFAYLLNNNVQFDISSGYGNNKGVKDYFISTGISWRIVPKKSIINSN